MIKINWKDLLLRSMWTFIEAFLVALPATIKLDVSGAEWKAVLLSALAAGISAVKTFIVSVIQGSKEKEEEKVAEILKEDE